MLLSYNFSFYRSLILDRSGMDLCVILLFSCWFFFYYDLDRIVFIGARKNQKMDGIFFPISFNSIGDQINTIVTRNNSEFEIPTGREKCGKIYTSNKFLIRLSGSYDNFNHNGSDIISNFFFIHSFIHCLVFQLLTTDLVCVCVFFSHLINIMGYDRAKSCSMGF